VRGGLRFAFYGRVSTEDWQDPVTSRARQLVQAQALVAEYVRITGEYFDAGQSRVLPWARRHRPPPWWPRWPTRAAASTF
jgi:site-specific DNA recombinase